MHEREPAPLLTPEMAGDLADELQGLAGSADEPEQYDAKIAALRAIERGLTRVSRVRLAAIVKPLNR